MSDDPETAFPAAAKVPGQAESRKAYERFMENTGLAKEQKTRAELAVEGVWLTMEQPPTWLEMYLQLRAKGWDWRKATFIAWSACPTDKRWPKTLSDLAITVLSLKSDRTIRQWRDKDPKIDEEISKLLIAEMMDHRQGAIQAMIKVAETPEASGFNDRQMLLRITKVIVDKSQVELSGPGGGPMEHSGVGEFSGMSDDELEHVIANLQTAERATSSSAG